MPTAPDMPANCQTISGGSGAGAEIDTVGHIVDGANLSLTTTVFSPATTAGSTSACLQPGPRVRGAARRQVTPLLMQAGVDVGVTDLIALMNP